MEKTKTISDLEDHLGYWLRRVSNQVSHSFKTKLEAVGVTVAEWVALRMLYDLPETPPSVLADRMGMTRGAVSKLVERLVQKAWVTRAYATDDRRYQTIGLTPAGRALVPELAQIADGNDAFFFSGLSPEQQAQLVEMMKQIAGEHAVNTVPTE